MEKLPTGCAEMLDGYQLIRFLGRGGFGEVWLCRSEAMGDYRALKWIPGTNEGRLEKEYEALLNYRKAAAALRSPFLVPIEHVGRTEAGLYYIMPLADGLLSKDPTDPEWSPLSLTDKLCQQAIQPSWLSSSEIIELMEPVLEGLQTLSEAGLVHRDVKPDNILFFNGKACLGDISLLGVDPTTITRHGTPGYSTPSWYQKGHPDMFGAAATLYSVLTGNPPDRMGRSAFLWPPQGENSLSPEEKAEWKRLHRVVGRAIEEKVSERYLDFRAMGKALTDTQLASASKISKKAKLLVAGLATVALSILAIAIMQLGKPSDDSEPPPQENTSSELPELTPDQKADYTALVGMVLGYLQDGKHANALASVEELLATYPQARTQPGYSVARAMALEGLGRLDEAKEELRREINHSTNISAMTSRVDLWKEMGDLEGAENDVTRVLDTFGHATLPLFLRAEVRAQRGNFAGVQQDREAAYLCNPGESAQKRLVDAMWTPLETKYPGYGAFLGKSAGETTDRENDPDAITLRPPKMVDRRGSFRSLREKVIEIIPVSVTAPADGKVRLSITERGETIAIRKAYQARDYSKCLQLMEQRASDFPVLQEDHLFILLKALVLTHLDRSEQVEGLIAKVQKPPESGTMKSLEAELILLESLKQYALGEKLVSAVLDAVPDTTEIIEMIILYNHRARFRILNGDHEGALADEHAALQLEPRPDPQFPLSKKESYQRHLNTIVMQWELLEQEFPAYEAYLQENDWPEPKPDHRKYRAED